MGALSHPQQHRRGDDGDRGAGESLEQQRRPRQAYTPRQQPADPDHRGEVEGVRSDEHADADAMGALGQGEQRRGDLGTICGEGRQQADERLGEPEPHAEPIEPAREARGRVQRPREASDEQRDCQDRGHRFFVGESFRGRRRDADQPSRHTWAQPYPYA
jgi:hypothetical protein